MNRRQFLQATGATALMLTMSRRAYAFQQSPLLKKFGPGQKLPGLGASGIPVANPTRKVVNEVLTDTYTIIARPYAQQMHPSLNPTKLWGYADATKPFAPVVNRYVGPAIVATRGVPVRITYKNQLSLPHPLPVDLTIANAPSFTRMAPHLHGGLVPWWSDGGPWSWFDRDGTHGSDYVTNVYEYPNNQSARLVWYHDHADGITRLNAYAGLAAAYVVTDAFENSADGTGLGDLIPGPLNSIYLVLQEKTFQPNGQLWYPTVYENLPLADFVNPAFKGRWDRGPATKELPLISCIPEFYGDTALVNGMAYPYVEVPPQLLRFRMLNGCQARVLNLQLYKRDGTTDGMSLVDSLVPDPSFPAHNLMVPGTSNPAGPSMIHIGTEGGFLRAPAVLPNKTIGFDLNGNPNQYTLLLASGERADVLVDFSNANPGDTFILYNDAPAPFPGGDPRNDYFFGNSDLSLFGGAPATQAGFGPNTRTFMEIRVVAGPRIHPPADLVAKLTARLALPANDATRVLAQGARIPLRKTLNEVFDDYGRLTQTLGTDLWNIPAQTYGLGSQAAPTEVVHDGDTQVWDVYNFTADTHPIHFHLVDVQILGRAPLAMALIPPTLPSIVGAEIDFSTVGPMRPPDANENGWKETVRMNPGEVTRVIMKFVLPVTTTFSNRLALMGLPNAAEYVWHCHILEHEEHDMMRPLVVLPALP